MLPVKWAWSLLHISTGANGSWMVYWESMRAAWQVARETTDRRATYFDLGQAAGEGVEVLDGQGVWRGHGGWSAGGGVLGKRDIHVFE